MIYGVQPYIIFLLRRDIMEKKTFVKDYNSNVSALNLRLRISESFDLVSRQIMVGQRRVMMYFIDGMIEDDLMEKIMCCMMNTDEKKIK